MTIATVDDYLKLIPPEHAGQPNFLEALTAFVAPFVDGQNLAASLAALFDVDFAVGQQLDFVGQWVGISRRLRVPIPNKYFSFNIANIGVNQGIWFNPDDPTEGIVTLDDSTYRLMIRAKILANIWDGSLGEANAGLQAIFDGTVQLQDNFDMTYSIITTGTLSSALFVELVQQGYIPLHPAGVALV
jgi:hypothetical protein